MFRAKWERRHDINHYYHGFFIGQVYYDTTRPSGSLRVWKAQVSLPGFKGGGLLGYFLTELNAMKLLETRVDEWKTQFVNYGIGNGVEHIKQRKG